MESPLIFETNIRPRNHAVLIKPLRQANMYKGTIHLPDRSADASNTGIVVRTGHLVRSVHVGEWVLYNWRQAITLDDDFIVLDERALIAVLAEPKEVLISAGAITCWDQHCPHCLRRFVRIAETKKFAIESIIIDGSFVFDSIKKFEALLILGAHTLAGRYLYGYAAACRVPVFDIYDSDDEGTIQEIIDKIRPKEEE